MFIWITSVALLTYKPRLSLRNSIHFIATADFLFDTIILFSLQGRGGLGWTGANYWGFGNPLFHFSESSVGWRSLGRGRGGWQGGVGGKNEEVRGRRKFSISDGMEGAAVKITLPRHSNLSRRNWPAFQSSSICYSTDSWRRDKNDPSKSEPSSFIINFMFQLANMISMLF